MGCRGSDGARPGQRGRSARSTPSERGRGRRRGVDDGAKTKSSGGRARGRACGAKRVGGPRFGRACGASAWDASPAPACGAETALGPLGLAAPWRARRPPAPAPPGARLRRKLHGELRAGSSLRRKPHGTRRGGDALTLGMAKYDTELDSSAVVAASRDLEINDSRPTAGGRPSARFPPAVRLRRPGEQKVGDEATNPAKMAQRPPSL